MRGREFIYTFKSPDMNNIYLNYIPIKKRDIMQKINIK